jgi:hypothetical protein
MEEFDTKIRKLLFHDKLLTLKSDIYLDKLDPIYFEMLISKLLVNFNYQLYNNNVKQLINLMYFNLYIPLYNPIENKLYNLSIDGFKIKDLSSDILILPICILIDGNNAHIVVFYINLKYKHVLYYDSCGINNTYNKLKKHIKKFLLDNNYIDNTYKFNSFNCPLQKYINDKDNIWFENGSCVIIVSLFTYIYFSLNSDLLFNKLINFCKIIKKKNINKFKDLLLYSYLAITQI